MLMIHAFADWQKFQVIQQFVVPGRVRRLPEVIFYRCLSVNLRRGGGVRGNSCPGPIRRGGTTPVKRSGSTTQTGPGRCWGEGGSGGQSDQEVPPPPRQALCLICYAASGMPVAFTQEEFPVLYFCCNRYKER